MRAAGWVMTVDFAEQRRKMVDGQLRTTDVTDRAILGAMLEIPREEFVPTRRRQLAYIDEDIEVSPASDGRPARFIMEPAPFAKLIQQALIKPHEFVLDIGCTTGYSAAVLSRLAGSVVALESDEALAQQASSMLERLDCNNVAVVTGPLNEGYAAEAPYDLIVIEGAVEHVPDVILAQLKDGGRLMAVVGLGFDAQATLFVRQDGVVSSRRLFNAAVRPLAEFRREPEFQF